MLLIILTEKKLLDFFTKRTWKKTNHKRVEKVIKRKDDKLYVQWKGYDSF